MTTRQTLSLPGKKRPSNAPDEGLERDRRRDGKRNRNDFPEGAGAASGAEAVPALTPVPDEDYESCSASPFSLPVSVTLKDSKDCVQENSSDTEEDESPKRPRLDEDLVTDWYDGPLFRLRDQRQCNEYFLRGRNLIRCFAYLQEGHDLSSRHSRRLYHTLYAGKHNSLEHRNKTNSEYVRRAREEHEALLVILYRRDGTLMRHYLLAALVSVQKSHMLVCHVRLMEVALLLLKEENSGVEDLRTVVALCRHVEYSSLRSFLWRPPAEVMVGVVHSLLYRMTPADLYATLHRHHKCIYQLACAPVFGLLGYRGVPPRLDTAILFNNSAKIFHDYLGDEAHLLLLVALRAALPGHWLGRLSDLLLDRVARAARTTPAPPGTLRHLEDHVQATDSRPGPRGCVAMLRLLRRCHRQLGQLRDLPALLQRLVALLVARSDRPMTAARDLGRLLFLLRRDRPALLLRTVQDGKAAMKDYLSGGGDAGGDVGMPKAAARYFLINMVRLVVVAARASALLPVADSDSDGDSDWESEEPDEPEIRPPPPEEVLATLLGLCGRQVEPRASWSGLACEVSYLLVGEAGGPQDCLVTDAVLQLATRLEDGDHRQADLHDLPIQDSSHAHDAMDDQQARPTARHWQ